MIERLEELERELVQVEAMLGDPEVIGDPRRLAEVARRHKELGEIVACGRELRSATEDLQIARSLLPDTTGEDREVVRAEIQQAEEEEARLSEELRALLVPRDPNDDRDVIVEIRGAEGGEEANLWARDLYEMYRAYAEREGWRVEVMGSAPSAMGGFTEVSFTLRGEGVWRRMKHEAGPHRVQRVPVTESQGRVHTSSATVTVLPEADEVDVEIDPNDLQVDVYRSSGPGGQSVNTTDSAVRITHLPTGTVVAMQDEKSQRQNREKAMRVLRARLLRAEQERRAEEESGRRRAQIGGGGRAEKVRTYNFKENRVTDHRIGLTLHKLDRILAGDLGGLLDALVQEERASQLRGEPAA